MTEDMMSLLSSARCKLLHWYMKLFSFNFFAFYVPFPFYISMLFLSSNYIAPFLSTWYNPTYCFTAWIKIWRRSSTSVDFPAGEKVTLCSRPSWRLYKKRGRLCLSESYGARQLNIFSIWICQRNIPVRLSISNNLRFFYIRHSVCLLPFLWWL